MIIQPYKYLLVIQPPQDIYEKIVMIKKQFYVSYKSAYAIAGRPHITIASFIQSDTLEDTIRHKLRLITSSCTPFKIELLDFGSFPSHTIYININSRLAITNLVKSIREHMQKFMKMDNNKPLFIIEPHLTIARKLKPWQYEKAWLEYAEKHFSARFITNNMLLLRKKPDEQRYALVERFEFHNIPILATQATLF